MKQRIEKMLIPALEKIKIAFPVAEGEEIIIPRTFSGSISGLGSAISQMGLLPALAVYTAEESGDQGKHRSKIIDLVAKVVASYDSSSLDLQTVSEGKALFQMAIELYNKEKNDLDELQEILLDAAVAVKLALRTFPREGNQQNGKDEEE